MTRMDGFGMWLCPPPFSGGPQSWRRRKPRPQTVQAGARSVVGQSSPHPIFASAIENRFGASPSPWRG
jgi:hypothetical protein